MPDANTADQEIFRFSPPVWVDKVESTNTALRQEVRKNGILSCGAVLAAKSQTAGRGRFQREWIATPGRDLTFSFVVGCAMASPVAAALPMATALGIHDFLQTYSVDGFLKWPNDVLVDGRKISGILSEQEVIENNSRTAIIVGVGVNLNMTVEQAGLIDQPATSLAIETGKNFEVEAVLVELLACCEPYLQKCATNGFSGLRERWMQHCLYLDDEIAISHEGGELRGRLDGFGEDGELLLNLGDGVIRPVWSGDVSRLRCC